MSFNSQPSSTSGGDDDNNKVFVNFNQESTSLAVGSKNGFRLFDIRDKVDLLYKDDSQQTIIIAERLFSSSLLAMVSLSSTRKLEICHFQRNAKCVPYSYNNTILAVKLNRERLVVLLEESIYIHNMKDMKHIHSILQTPRNPNGIIALAPCSDNQKPKNCYLAYPAKNTTGEVNIFDALELKNKLTIAAHDNPLVSLTFDSQGFKLATASDRGTVIRVFNTQNGDLIYEFRRGYARCVSIYSLSFSLDSMFLCASSNTETVHIFKLTENTPQEDDMTKMVCKKIIQVANYFNPLPSTIPSIGDIMNQWRSFATVKLPLSGSKTICTITNTSNNGGGSTDQRTPQVLIATTDGYLYVYDLNINEGGDCTLLRQHCLLDDNLGTSNTNKKQNNITTNNDHRSSSSSLSSTTNHSPTTTTTISSSPPPSSSNNN